MPVISISLDELGGAMGDRARLSAWCEALEAGGVLYFPETPLPIAAEDLEFLLERKQTESGLHKNIAYKPGIDRLSGVDEGSATAEGMERLRGIMRRYSASVEGFLAKFMAPYERRWVLDYASYRQIEEKNRELPLRKRNNLLHTDAFPTRPTYGRRILRFFHNINPTETRDWVIGEPFPRVVGHFAPGKLAIPHADGGLVKAGKGLAQAVGLAGLVPQLKRSPYDEFMMQLHNAMKEDAAFQETCVREEVSFKPGSSWMVYTETVPHAVLAGQYAMEQTFLVDAGAMVRPELAPVAVLEKMAGAKLV